MGIRIEKGYKIVEGLHGGTEKGYKIMVEGLHGDNSYINSERLGILGLCMYLAADDQVY